MAEASMASPRRRSRRPRHAVSGRISQVTLMAAELCPLTAAPASADTAVPLLGIVWPIAWLLLLPIIHLEAWVATRVLHVPFTRGLKDATVANLVSTAVNP